MESRHYCPCVISLKHLISTVTVPTHSAQGLCIKTTTRKLMLPRQQSGMFSLSGTRQETTWDLMFSPALKQERKKPKWMNVSVRRFNCAGCKVIAELYWYEDRRHTSAKKKKIRFCFHHLVRSHRHGWGGNRQKSPEVSSWCRSDVELEDTSADCVSLNPRDQI